MGMENLLKKLQDQPKTVEEHFAEKKQEWIEDVAALISAMETWLKPLVDGNLARLERRTVDLDEPDTGGYSVDALTIYLGGREVKVEPRGMRIVGVVPTGRDRVIGARGRVDLVYGPSRATILRRSGGSWQLASADGWPADKSAVDLTQETFADALAELIPDAHRENGS
jgi:hypothetical protein